MSTVRVETLHVPAVTAARSVAALSRGAFWTLMAAHVVAGWGTQWDIQWHLRIGRDSFWIAPHVITYSGVTLMVLVSFGMLAWTSWRALHGEREAGMLRLLGVTGTRGWHFAAWSIVLTVLAAPIDDLWHRLFGLDVTLWSPPHLLGLVGATLNAAAGWIIARESFAADSRARQVALVVAGAVVTGGLSVSLQPSIRMAYVHGGVRFFTYAMLGALLLPLGLVTTARLSRWRVAPALVLPVMLAFGFAGDAGARTGFAWLRPVSFIAEEIAKDPTSPIAISHEIARKNRVAPGAAGLRPLLVVLLAGVAIAAIDGRRRPIGAAIALGLILCAGVGLALSRQPAFAQSLPSTVDTVVALMITLIAAIVGGALAARVSQHVDTESRRFS